MIVNGVTVAAIPVWIWILFVFAYGACIGSFLNVVIYRLPRDLSLWYPGSHCPSCSTPIAFYDNIPIISWLLLRGRCRRCGCPISPRYVVIELLTGLLFVAVFLCYFVFGFWSYFAVGQVHTGIDAFLHGGWLIYLLHVILISGLLAASAIDLELWVIPISICWVITIAGLLASAAGAYVLGQRDIGGYFLLPYASATTAALAAGGGIGMAISVSLLSSGLLKGSYLVAEEAESTPGSPPQPDDIRYNHRVESLKEILFLLPIILGAIVWFYAYRSIEPLRNWWLNITQIPALRGFLGSLWGYYVGAGIVWATRILGTFAFGKEAMGLGDVHLMGAAGAIIGPLFIVVAFFVAPFFGLAWAIYQMFFQKTRQIPYGPFLSLAIFGVMIFHDSILTYLSFMFLH